MARFTIYYFKESSITAAKHEIANFIDFESAERYAESRLPELAMRSYDVREYESAATVTHTGRGFFGAIRESFGVK